LSRAIDEFGRWLSRIAVWLVLLAALLSAFNAFFRYFINEIIVLAHRYQRFGLLQGLLDWYGNNSNAFLEAQWYMFGVMAMFGAAYTLKVNEHVRVDLIYSAVSERVRIWIDILGCLLFLLPICVILIYFTWPWFLDSWRIDETSSNAGGLIRWPVKLILPLGFALMALQGISELIKRIAGLMGVVKIDTTYEKPLQ
jgi:TRAP-type mannitol/chloroaromatic compound transport system permease small subunit